MTVFTNGKDKEKEEVIVEATKEEKKEAVILSEEDCIRETKEHIAQVREFMIMFAQDLMQRALVHDESKLEEPELGIFREFTPKLATSTYGSEEYEGFRSAMKPALDNHYAKNSHHPEHYENGVNGMNLADLVEMFCDWKAASMRHSNGDITQSIKTNTDRFKLDKQVVDIFTNSIPLVDTTK
jgi:Family of unknown function (DUF5662)